MRYTFYKLLQNYVHAGYALQKATLSREFKVHISSLPERLDQPAVLELACGDGNLADVFPPENYLGIELAKDRIASAQRSHPAYKFTLCNVNTPQFSELVREFDFIFCHAFLHHLNDQDCRRLLDNIQLMARKPTTFVAMEPVLPAIWRNPFGFVLCKLDLGRYIRFPQGYRLLFGDRLVRAEWLNGSRRWPIDGEAYILRSS